MTALKLVDTHTSIAAMPGCIHARSNAPSLSAGRWLGSLPARRGGTAAAGPDGALGGCRGGDPAAGSLSPILNPTLTLAFTLTLKLTPPAAAGPDGAFCGGRGGGPATSNPNPNLDPNPNPNLTLNPRQRLLLVMAHPAAVKTETQLQVRQRQTMSMGLSLLRSRRGGMSPWSRRSSELVQRSFVCVFRTRCLDVTVCEQLPQLHAWRLAHSQDAGICGHCLPELRRHKRRSCTGRSA